MSRDADIKDVRHLHIDRKLRGKRAGEEIATELDCREVILEQLSRQRAGEVSIRPVERDQVINETDLCEHISGTRRGRETHL